MKAESTIRKELLRTNRALNDPTKRVRLEELVAVQQTLAWALGYEAMRPVKYVLLGVPQDGGG